MLDKVNNRWRQSTSRQYESDEVNRIIRRALKLEQSGAVSHNDLLETAAELGIDPLSLEVAVMKERAGFKTAEAHRKKRRRRRDRFKSHLWSYIIVITGLFLINAMTPGPWWFQWPLLGWGMGLALHGRAVIFNQR